MEFLKSILFGKNMDAILVVIILEWILAVYGIGMTIATKKLWAKIINIVLTILWVVCAILNMIEFLG
ncbi:MAG: hypothetical protein II044_03540 [Lachnospiraceae bacterium]|nr:hypothetical protein [Lachnospiraceae bacterium]MDD6148836.1 hypothetical protein [Lachnospiraceae bacterium]MDY5703373.1 hypothetical protein [Lachnospiraceae bacterium]MEE3356593.1 hypothetical protein [Lachnospiraceae bacterium]